MALRTQDLINQQYETIVSNLTSLLNSCKVENSAASDVAGAAKAGPAGALPALYVESILLAAEKLLGITRLLKRNALLNDHALLRAKVAAASQGAREIASLGHGDEPPALEQAEFPSQALSMGLDDAFAMEEF